MKPSLRRALLSALIPLSLLGPLLSPSTQAQPSVVLYGQADLSLRYTDNDDGIRGNTWRIGPSGLFGNYLGLKGEEPLGGQSQAFFQLENGFRPDTGAVSAQSPGTNGVSLFGRQSLVGLRGDWGQLSMGRQYNALMSLYAFLPIGDQLFVGGDHFFSGARSNNSLIYKKSLGPWSLELDLGLGEQAGSLARKSMLGANLGYQAGAFKGALAYLQNRSMDGSTLGQYANLGASRQFGPALRLSGGYARSQESGNTRRHRDIAFVSLGYQLDPRWSAYSNYFIYRQSDCNGSCQKRPGAPDNVTGGIDNSFAGFATSTRAGHAHVLVLIAAYTLAPRSTLYAETDWLFAKGGAAQDHLYSQNRNPNGRNSLRQANFTLGLRQAF